MKKLTLLTFFVVLLAFSGNLFAQAITFESAKAKYEAKEYEKAVKEFEILSKTDKTNANVWNYLGLSYRATDDGKRSIKAFKKAIKLAPTDNAIQFNYAVLLTETGSQKAIGEINKILRAEPDQRAALYLRGAYYIRSNEFSKARADAQRLIELDPKAAAGYLLSTRILEQKMNDRIIQTRSTALEHIDFLKQAIDMLEGGAAKCGDCADREAFEYQLNNEKMLYDRVQKNDYDLKIRPAGLPGKDNDDEKPGDKRLKILSKRPPRYTDAARVNNVSGNISVLVLFGASGQIESAILASTLGYGLDENALNAARQIRFTPQIKNGKPISTLREVEYTFSVF